MDPERKKAASRVRYRADPEKKKAVSKASYRDAPEKKKQPFADMQENPETDVHIKEACMH